MKIVPAVMTASLIALQSIVAQENAPPEKFDLIPSSPRTPPAAADPLPLIPESPESAKKQPAATERKKEKKSSTEVAADDLQQRIRYRQAKTRALNDPAVQSAWNRAHATRTDFERREAMKAYYKLLFSRMLRIDGTLKQRVALSEQRALRRLTQTRIDPTEPLDPDERAERFRE